MQFGIPWQDIAAANGLRANSRLNVGQELIIPLAGLPPTAVPTRPPAATATSAPPAPTPAPAIALAAPVLRNPSNETPFQGDNAMIVLNWNPVPGLPAEARYQMTIRWTEKGAPQEWCETTTATEMRMPPLAILQSGSTESPVHLVRYSRATNHRRQGRRDQSTLEPAQRGAHTHLELTGMTTDFEFALSQIAENDRLVRNMNSHPSLGSVTCADGKLPRDMGYVKPGAAM